MKNKINLIEEIWDNEIKNYFSEDFSNNLKNKINRLYCAIQHNRDTKIENFIDIPYVDEGEFYGWRDEDYPSFCEAVTAMVAENNRIQKCIRRAKNIGLCYWPALAFGPKINPKAFLIAEEILQEKTGRSWGEISYKGEYTHLFPAHGGWDMQGFHGLSPYQVAKAWYASGCSDRPKFRKAVFYGCCHLIKKGDSEVFCSNIFRGMVWLRSNFPTIPESGFCFKRNTISTLGRLSPPLRWAAIKGLDFTQTRIAVRDLNWQEVARVQGKRKNILAANCPVRSQWEMVFEIKTPDGLEGISPLISFKLGVYKQLCKAVGLHPFEGNDTAAGHRLPCFKLATIFASIQEVKRFIKLSGKKMDALGIHDIGQFNFPVGMNADWKSLILKHGSEVLKYTAMFKGIEELHGAVPKSLTILRDVASRITYNTSNLALAEAAAKAKFNQDSFDQYEKYWSKLSKKEYESIPAPTVNGGNYRVQQLSAHDPIAPLMGILTNCCQHPNGAARACAKATIERPDCSVWVVMKGEEIIAQTFVYRSGDTLVLDSVESKDHNIAERIADVLLSAIHSVIGRLNVNKINIGNTCYGITRELIRCWNICEEAKSKCSPVGYTDANIQIRVV